MEHVVPLLSTVSYGYHSILHQFESVNPCPHFAVLWSRHVAAAVTRYGFESASSFLRHNIAEPNVLNRTQMSSGRLPERPMMPEHRKAVSRRYMDRRPGGFRCGHGVSGCTTCKSREPTRSGSN
jgi:hypothetical protein